MYGNKNIYKAAMAAYTAVAIFATTKFILQGNWYSAAVSAGSLVFLLIRPAMRRFLKFDMGYRLGTLFIVFCFMSYQMGTALEWFYKYYFAPWFVQNQVMYITIYDKVLHVLSGILFTLFGLCIYQRLSKPITDRKCNALLQIFFAVGFAMFTAVLWEIHEFLGYILIGHDSQQHTNTGVFDTMLDLISGLIGGIIMSLDFLLYVRKGARSPLTKTMEYCDNANRLMTDTQGDAEV